MQPIVHMIALSCSLVLLIFAVGFFAIGKLNQWSFLIMIAFAIVVGFGIEWGVKKFWFKVGSAEVGLDTLKNDLDEYTQEKLKEIQTDVNLHKASITEILKNVNEAGERLSEHGKSITAILKDVNEADERLSKHSKSINDLITHAMLVNSKIRETIENTTPPGLELFQKNIVSTDEGFAISLFFQPDRRHYTCNEDVIIYVSIKDNENSKILRMEKLERIQVDLDGPFVEPDNKTGVIKAEGKTAALVYKFPVRFHFSIGIEVTESCKLFIRVSTGSIERNEFEIDVSK